MIDGIVSALGGVKGAMDIAKGINATITAAEVAEVKLGLLSSLSDAQIALAEAREQEQLARERIRALEAEVAELRAWGVDVESYELADVGKGGRAYRLKGTDPANKDGNWYCPHCFANRKKALMMPQDHGAYGVVACHPCGLEVLAFGYLPSARRR